MFRKHRQPLKITHFMSWILVLPLLNFYSLLSVEGPTLLFAKFFPVANKPMYLWVGFGSSN